MRTSPGWPPSTSPLTLVISGDIYRTVVRHGYHGINQHAFRPWSASTSPVTATPGGFTSPSKPHSSTSPR